MPKAAKQAARKAPAAVAKELLDKLSDDERRQINRLIRRAIEERDLPRFRAAILKLGFDENSAQYERLMQLWDEHAQASRHG